jgi:putative transposase
VASISGTRQAAEGKTGEEIAAELGVSTATLYNWRRTYGGMDTDAAKELTELREQNGRLKRLLAEAELERRPKGGGLDVSSASRSTEQSWIRPTTVVGPSLRGAIAGMLTSA